MSPFCGLRKVNICNPLDRSSCCSQSSSILASSQTRKTVTTTYTAPDSVSRERCQPSATDFSVTSAGALIKRRIAKKLVNAAAITNKRSSQTVRTIKLLTRVSANSTPAKDSVARPGRRPVIGADCSPAEVASIRRAPAVIPAELCQDPNGQPVSVHDFIEYVCFHGTPCLSPRLSWFSEPRAKRTCPSAHLPGGLSSKLEELDPANPVASRCTAAATPPKQCINLRPVTTGAAAVPDSTLQIPPGHVDETPLLTKSPMVSVAKKIASVNYTRSVTSSTDLFTVLSRTMGSGSRHPVMPDRDFTNAVDSSFPDVSDPLSSKKIIGTKRSARQTSKLSSRTRRGTFAILLCSILVVVIGSFG
ncbi:hypothetical protein FGIG_03200 [Fasciola gigantica]|uniref:Uncharacterized protein n=1 Tax=Fasciola gigantica TaxID=46835 RepID=A0A504YNT3_FASGI|nr:hypothetical protein FGIG_03200 [Fasciola gigantica]